MQDLPIVYVLDGEANLCEVVQDGLFAEVLGLAKLLTLLPPLLEMLLKGAIITVIHDDIEHASLVAVDFSESHNVWVTEDL